MATRGKRHRNNRNGSEQIDLRRPGKAEDSEDSIIRTDNLPPNQSDDETSVVQIDSSNEEQEENTLSALPLSSVNLSNQNGQDNDSSNSRDNILITKEEEITRIIDEKISELQQAYSNISELEIEIERLNTKLRKLDSQREKIREKLSASIEEAEQLKIRESELQGINHALREALEKEQGLRDKLASRSELLNRQEKRLYDLRDSLETIGESWSPEKVKELTVKNEILERQVNKLGSEIIAALELLDEANKRINELNQADLIQLRVDNQALNSLVTSLQQQLLQYEADKKKIIEFKQLLLRATQLDKENPALLEENTRLKKENTRLRALISEEETYKSLYSQNRINYDELTKQIEQQNENEQQRLASGQRAYDSLLQLVQDPKYNRGKTTPWPGDSNAVTLISNFVKKYNFDFEEHQIRAFLAAMRSSRLIILKGFSGTGKSSLPQMIGLALGSPCVVIPVQPSWKSKVDLLGFFNHFEQRFLPTLFTKSLVKAMLPAFDDRPFFILLDEMNLARVEYYFSDINAKLQNENDPTIELFENIGYPTSLKSPSKTLIENNVISIPRNITFIGTINDDETTYTISDKIYDRAQVIDFQSPGKNHKKGEIPDPTSCTAAYSFKSYLDTWKGSSLSSETQKLFIDFINNVNEELRKRFATMLSYRPREQMYDFLRAYELSGGDPSEGLDLQIVSKVIPKIRPRGDYLENINQFENAILRLWPYKSNPEHTMTALELLKAQA